MNILKLVSMLLLVFLISCSKDVGYYFEKSSEYIDEENYNYAIELLEAAKIQYPQESKIHYRLGYCYFKVDSVYKAMKSIEIALELDPDNAQAFNQKSYILARMNLIKQALDAMTKAIELEPNNGLYYCNRGNIYAKYFDDRSLYYEDYLKSIELNYEQPHIYSNLGAYASSVGNPEMAINYYSRAIELDSGYAPAYRNRSTSYEELELHEEAILDLKRAIDLEPIKGLSFRGRLYQRRGELEKSLDDFNDLIKLDSANYEHWLHRGNSFYDLGMFTKALDDYQEALSRNQEDLDVKYMMAHAFWGLKDYSTSEFYFEQVLEIDSTFKDTKRKLEKVRGQSDPPLAI